METFWTILAFAFTIGAFTPILVVALALPAMLLAAIWVVTTRRAE